MIDYVSNADTLKSEREDIFLFFLQAKTPVKDKPPKVPKDTTAKVKSEVKVVAKVKDDSSESKSDTPKSISPAPSGTPPSRETPTIQVEEVKGQSENMSHFCNLLVLPV